MRTLTLIDFYANLDARQRMEAAARRERARQIALFVKRLLEKAPRHAARPRLAAQG